MKTRALFLRFAHAIFCAIVLIFSAKCPRALGGVIAGPITNSANGHLYYLLSTTNWNAAETMAVSLGGHLATINDTNENTWIFNNIASYGGGAYDLWFGLNDVEAEGTWYWTDGEAATYRNWNSGEPNNSGDQAVMRGPTFNPAANWNDDWEPTAHPAVVEVALATPPTITAQPQNKSAGIGGSATFTVMAYGSPTLTYQWLRDGTNVDGATSTSLTLANVQLADSGTTYSVIVSNAFGTDTSSNAVLTVGVVPGISSQPQGVGTAPGTDVTFTVVANGAEPLYYQWRRNGSNLTGATNSSLLLTNVQSVNAGTYTVRITNSFGSIISSNAVLSVGTPPSITTHPQNRTVPAGTNVTFTVSATGAPTLIYQWRLEGTNLPGATFSSLTLNFVQPANSGTYSVRVTNSFGSVISSNAVLTVTPVDPVIAGPITNPANGHLYYLLSPAPWNAAEATAVSLGGHLATINDTNENTWIYNNIASYGGGAYDLWIGLNDVAEEDTWVWVNGEVATYQNWNTGEPNNSGDQAVMRGPTFNPSANWNDDWESTPHPAVVEVMLATAPTVTGHPQNQSVVPGGSATFTVTAFGSSPLAYQWLRDGTNVDGATSSSLTLTNLQLADSGTTYSVIVTNGFGSDTSSNALLTVGLAPSISSQPQSQAVPVGSNVTYTVVAGGANPLYYQWRRNGANIAGATDSLLELTNVQLSAAGNYSVKITNDYGSVISSNAVLTLEAEPVITSQPQSQTLPAGTNVSFVVSATGTPTLRYQWRRDGTNLAGATGNSLLLVNVQPSNDGAYSVRITNAYGSVISSDATLTVTPPTVMTNPILAGPITNPANSHVYYLLAPTNWNAAEARAVSLGGHLTTINNSDENAWIYTTFGSYGGAANDLWLGLNDVAVEGTWVWVNGETSVYRNWNGGEPNNGGGYVPNEDHVVMRGPSFNPPANWNDDQENQHHCAVVEIGNAEPPQPPQTNSILAGPITNSANGHVYYLLTRTNWNAAEAIAVSLGGHLTTINGAAENAWIFDTFGNYGGTSHDFWLGLTDVSVEGTWVWVNGETNSYRNWNAGEPNNGWGGNEDYAVMRGPSFYPAANWNDDQEASVHEAIVEVGDFEPPLLPPDPPNPIVGGPITNSVNGHVYYLLTPTNWFAAETIAVSLNGHLATINDTNENDWVYNTFGNFGGLPRNLWIGLNDAATENTWVWVSSESGVFRYWAPGEPNNGNGYYTNENHAVIRGPDLSYASFWNDVPYYHKHLGVVEVVLESPIQAATVMSVASQPGVTLRPDGSAYVRFTGEVGVTYTIEASTDLVNWDVVGTVTGDEFGICLFVEPDAANYQGRFYRLARP